MQAERNPRPKRVLGQWARQVWIADDVDATPEEWLLPAG
jgi:hypothetical protein